MLAKLGKKDKNPNKIGCFSVETWFFSVFLRIFLCVYLYFVRKVCDRCYLCDKSVTC